MGNITGTALRSIDGKNRVFLPSMYKIRNGEEFSLIEESKSMYRVCLVNELIKILEVLKKGSYDSKDAEEKKVIYERICTTLTKISEIYKVDNNGRIVLSPNLVSTNDGYPSYENFVANKPRIMLIGEGIGFSAISNEETFKNYCAGEYGYDIESKILK